MKLLKKLMRIINKKDDMIDFLEQKYVCHQYDKHSIVVYDILILMKPCSTERLVYCTESIYLTSFKSFSKTMYIGGYIFDDGFPSQMITGELYKYWKTKASIMTVLNRVYINGYMVMSGKGILS